MIVAIGATAVIAQTGTLSAQETGKTGFYAAAAGGWTSRNDVDSTPVNGGNVTRIKHDNGYRIAGSIGYEFGNGIRSDIEVAYAKYDIDSMAHPLINGGGDTDGRGDVSSISTLLSVYYDFQNSSPFTPSLGIGVGPVRLSANNTTADNANFTTTDDTDWVTGVGSTLGVAYALSDQLSVVADYRFLWTTKPEMTDDANTTAEQDGVRSHTTQIGLRFNF